MTFDDQESAEGGGELLSPRDRAIGALYECVDFAEDIADELKLADESLRQANAGLEPEVATAAAALRTLVDRLESLRRAAAARLAD